MSEGKKPPPPGLGTRAVSHERLPAAQRPLVPPIVQSTTFHLDDRVYEAVRSGVVRGNVYLYSRYGNPTLEALEHKLAGLFGTESALVTASGMAAMSAVLFSALRPGGTVVAPFQLYGNTWRLLVQVLREWGVDVRFVEPEDTAAVGAALASGSPPRVLLVEALSNPLLVVPPLAALIEVARAREAVVVVDDTFLGPVRLQSAAIGADFVVESATKYLAGHSDVTAGVIAATKERIDALWPTFLVLGGCLDPHAAFLVDRGVQTIHLRCRAQDDNALAIAQWLERRDEVAWVRHPALPSHPQHARARELFGGRAAMVTFRHRGGDEAALRTLGRLGRIAAATSLGGVETLASLPFNTSHPLPEQQRGLGLEPGVVRLSVGVEDVADLIADLEAALAG